MFYLVKVLVDLEIVDHWHTWMKGDHIPDVLATGCFKKAWMTRQPELDTDKRRAYRILYLSGSRRAFDRYQRDFGEALKHDHSQRYEGRVEASRELLGVVAEIE